VCLTVGAAPASADDPFALRDTATAVDCRAIAIGDSSLCTAYVEDVALEGTPVTPTGQVTFDDGGAGGRFGSTTCELGDAGGLALCRVVYTPSAAGSPAIGATYSGDAIHAPSDAHQVLPVRKRTTSVSVRCPDSIVLGGKGSCVATVTDADFGTPTRPGGTVSFSGTGGTFSPAQCTLPDLGVQVCAVDYSPTAVEDGEVVARYDGDATHAARSGATVVGVTQRSVTTSLTCAAATIGHATTCTATVADAAAWPPTGSVRFSGGSFSAPACALSAAGECSVSYTPDDAGPHTLRADYDGDANHLADAAQTDVTAAKRPTVTAVACADPVTAGAPTRCTATVTDQDGGTATQPAGTVTIAGQSCELPAGESSCGVDYTPARAGDHALGASYGGDATHLPSDGKATITAARRSTTTSLACAPSSVELGSATTCTATVQDTDRGTASAPTGTVRFSNGAECALAGTGSCSTGYTPAATGPHTVTATYVGDADHAGSSGDADVTATRSEPRATATTLSCTPPSTLIGVFVTCAASVTDVDSGTPATPEGRVSFTGGPGTFAPATCALGADASCTTTYLPIAFATGSHALSATYAGTAAHGTSSGNAPVGVEKRPAHVAIACAPAKGAKGYACTVTVADTGAGVKSVPAGSVRVSTSNGATSKSPQACTLAAAACTVSYPQSLSGAKQITVEYAGGPAHLADAMTVGGP
jgi:hypothetical protein